MNSIDSLSISSGSGKKTVGIFSSRRKNKSNQHPEKKMSRNASQNFLSKFEKKQWKDIRKKLRSGKGNQLVLATGCYGITTLALALGHNAPLDIIQLILNLDPSLAEQKDVLGASPLHIACLNGAPVPSIKLLIERYPHLVADRDSDQRTPLHHAVEFICRLERNDDYDRDGIFDVISILIEKAPDIIHWTDKHGDSPLDLTHVVMIETDTSSYTEDESIFSRVDQLFKFLKRISIKVYLDKKKKWEEEGYSGAVNHHKCNDTFATDNTESTCDTSANELSNGDSK